MAQKFSRLSRLDRFWPYLLWRGSDGRWNHVASAVSHGAIHRDRNDEQQGSLLDDLHRVRVRLLAARQDTGLLRQKGSQLLAVDRLAVGREHLDRRGFDRQHL